MTSETGSGQGREQTAADMAAVRAWFDGHGWQLQPGELRHALQERAADDDLIVELIDLGADRRRAAKPRSQGPRTDTHTAASTSPVPPQNLEAEESVLGAAMLSPNAIKACRRIIQPDDFYRESHARIWRAIVALDDKNEPVDAITLTEELEERGELDHAGGRVRLHELAALVPATANAAHYATIVHETATLRGLVRAGGEIARLGWERPGDTLDLVEQARAIYDDVVKHAVAGRERISIVAATAFLENLTTNVGILLGEGDDNVLAEHSLAVVYGKGAAGKTTLSITLAAALCSATPWLGIPVPAARRVLMIENEGPRDPFIEKIKRFADQWDGADFLHNLLVYEKPWGLFNLADRGMRDDLLAFTRDHNIDIVMAGPLRDLALGVSSKPGTPEETSAFVALLKEAGLGTELAWWIVHHQNKQGQISGDWDRHPDTLIRYSYTGKRRNELIWEKVRHGDQGRAPMVLEWLDQGVGYRIIDTSVPDVDWNELEEKVRGTIKLLPGCSGNDVYKALQAAGDGAKKTHVMETIQRLLEQRQLEDRGTGKKGAARRLHIADGQRQQTLVDEQPPVPDEPEGLEWH